MAKDKAKSIMTGPAPPMNPSSSRLSPFGEPHGCDGDGCASDLNTWPLHHVNRRGEPCRLCCSCILLSERSLYCCCCFLLITSSSSEYDHDDPLMSPPSPTATCHVCREAVAHWDCLDSAEGIFVCPACTAAEEGRLFTYAPPCREPLDARASRVILLASRMALALLQRDAVAARSEAERLARVADQARRRAYRALSVAFDMDKQEDPSWYRYRNAMPVEPPEATENNRPAAPEEGTEKNIVDTPQAPMDHMAVASEEGSQAIVEDTLLVHRYEVPPMVTLTMGTGCATAAVEMAPADADSSHTSPWPWLLPPFGANEMTMATAGSSLTMGTGCATAAPAAADSSHTPPWPWPWSPPPFGANEAMATAGSSMANPSPPQTLNLFGVKEMAIAAAEAARASSSPPVPRTLNLFPADEASTSSKIPRSLQLFEDDILDDDEEM